MAQAAPPTLKSGGAVLGVGALVNGTSANLETETPLGLLTCEKVTLEGAVTVKEPASLEGGGSTKNCLANGAAPVEITEIFFEDHFLEGEEDEGFTFFEYDIPAVGLFGCTLEGEITTTWESGTNKVKVLPSALVGAGPGCPETGTIKGDLVLTTPAGAVVTVQ